MASESEPTNQRILSWWTLTLVLGFGRALAWIMSKLLNCTQRGSRRAEVNGHVGHSLSPAAITLITCRSERRCVNHHPSFSGHYFRRRVSLGGEGMAGPAPRLVDRRIHCRNGGSQIAEILISNIFFVWKSVAGARACLPACLPGRQPAKPAQGQAVESLASVLSVGKWKSERAAKMD